MSDSAQQLQQTPSSAPLPKYRYFQTMPETVRVTLAVLVDRLPPEALRQTGAEGEIDLRCSDVLEGNFPAIALSKLAALAPDLIDASKAPDAVIHLPPALLALGYHPITHRELIAEPEPVPDATPAASGGVLDPPPDPAVIDGKEAGAVPVAAIELPAASEQPAADPAPSEKQAPAPEAQQEIHAVEAKDELDIKLPRAPSWKRLLRPVLTRKERMMPEDANPAVAEELERLKAAAESLALSRSPQEAGASIELKKPAGPPSLAAVLKSAAPLPGQFEIQRLLMTDESLTLSRTIELSAALPGISGCLLARGPEVLTSSGLPQEMDLRTLSQHVLGLLELMRDDSAKANLPLSKVLTIYADSGPISFVQEGALCLTVVHVHRGFLPGVREKLVEILRHLDRAVPFEAGGMKELADQPGQG